MKRDRLITVFIIEMLISICIVQATCSCCMMQPKNIQFLCTLILSMKRVLQRGFLSCSEVSANCFPRWCQINIIANLWLWFVPDKHVLKYHQSCRVNWSFVNVLNTVIILLKTSKCMLQIYSANTSTNLSMDVASSKHIIVDFNVLIMLSLLSLKRIKNNVTHGRVLKTLAGSDDFSSSWTKLCSDRRHGHVVNC